MGATRITQERRDEIEKALRAGIRGDIRFGEHDRMLYATDASIYQVEPIGVVVPASIDDAIEAVRTCSRLNVPILPRGGGTSLAGQCTAHAVVIDFSAHCRAIGRVDEANGTCRAEAGVVLADLNRHIAHTGWFFAPDPATMAQANVGGCIANNAAGARSIRYGRMSENVLGVDVCLADGTRTAFDDRARVRDDPADAITRRVIEIVRAHASLIRERLPKTLRRNAGYALDLVLDQLDAGVPEHRLNLTPLLCGSEGTLAITLGATLALRRIPRARGLVVVAFPSVDSAIELVEPVLATGPSAVELLDDMVIGAALGNLEYRRYVDLLPRTGGEPPKAALYIEYEAETPDALAGAFEALRRVAGDRPMHIHTDARAMDTAWRLRRAGEPLLHASGGARKPVTFVEDNAVPVERLGEFVHQFREIVHKHGTTAAFYAHASVGLLHVRPLLDITDARDREHLLAIAGEVADLARSLGGVMSGEHGDGRVRGPLLERFYGPEIMHAFRQVKQAFDPRNLLNPGAIVDPGPPESITQSLRVLPHHGKPAAIPAVDSYFDYAEQHNMTGAAAACNGAGVCRKSAGGTMCPSYMALLDERHTTRGRANALRLALTGQLGEGGEPAWGDPDVLETLDLCLSCKGCKAECPSNVDLARLKAEYLAQSYGRGLRVPIASRLFARVHAMNRAASIMPRTANAIARSRTSRTILERMAGVDRRRALPAFARPLTKRWGRRKSAIGKPRVVLLADTFTTHNEPHIGLATKRVLEAFGYHVQLAPADDMARAAISLGLLDRAIAQADRALGAWRAMIDDTSIAAFLVCEPSCLSAITDDWIALKLRTSLPVRRALAELAMLPEHFLESRWRDHPHHPLFDQPSSDILLHAHCHQKALWGASSSARLLERLFPGRVTTLDAGCCGLAGSFGYHTRHYDLSMAIGEHALFPLVRNTSGIIAATGTSCRQQIAQGVGREVLHPMAVLDQLLRSGDRGGDRGGGPS